MGQAQQRAESGKDQVADRIGHASEAVHKAADALKDQEAWMAGLVERGADELAHLAETLRKNDLRSLLGHAEGLARREPMLFAGAAFAAGFAAVRATKAGLSSAPAARAGRAGEGPDLGMATGLGTRSTQSSGQSTNRSTVGSSFE